MIFLGVTRNESYCACILLEAAWLPRSRQFSGNARCPQVRQKATTVQHGRRQGQAQSYSTNEAGAGAEREARAERQQLYRAELDEQYRGHAMRGDSIGWSPARSVGGATGGQSTHRSRVVQAAVSPQDMRVAARQVKTMHWGEAEVQRWHEDEERKKAYKEDLMRQVAEKKVGSPNAAILARATFTSHATPY